MELENAPTAVGLDKITIDIIIIIIALHVKVPESVIDVKEPEYYNSKESLKSRFTISHRTATKQLFFFQ